MEPNRTQSEQDTIVAIATAPGRGGIGVVRLSGPAARAIAVPLVRLRHELAAGQMRFGELLDADTGAALDEVVVSFFAQPQSYTGEDVVEIAAHGSPVVLDAILRACTAAGARLAEPGEFTQRAFLAGRLDLTQAEAVNDLIQASTLHQARLAARQLGGSLSHAVAPIKQALVQLIATLEAGIDFAEDDIEVLPGTEIARQIDAVVAPARRLAESFQMGRIVREGLRLAIVGRPNVGKSSLFNRLLGRDRAIVTPVAGTTRDSITDVLSLEGIPVELTDTAGLRDVPEGLEGEAERQGIARSGMALADADVVLLVVDATLGFGFAELEIVRRARAERVLVAINKFDLVHVAPGLPDEMPKLRSIETSAITGMGLDELRRAILAVASAGSDAYESAMVTNSRQYRVLRSALSALEAAREGVFSQVPHEMVLLDLYQTLGDFDQLTGATTTDDILSLIFSSFCIGK